MRTMPDLIPILSRGRHRTPRRGACFMEYASFLAGETWSDHPSCTDPALASLARMINDCTTDAGRGRLVSLIPSVIGLTGDGTITGIRLAIRAASTALPIASEGRQRALAAGLLRCDELLANHGESGLSTGRRMILNALDGTPDASSWARNFLRSAGPRATRSIPLLAHAPGKGPGTVVSDAVSDAIIRTAVVGIADACVPDPNQRMRELLSLAIADCTPVDAAAVETVAVDAVAADGTPAESIRDLQFWP